MPASPAFLLAALIAAAGAGDPSGRWQSPNGHVTIAIAPCPADPALWCGRVVDADAKAIADTRRATGEGLIGMMLVRDMKSVSPGHWRGIVVIPDKKHIVRGALRMVGGQLEVKGCAARVICKRQRWRRAG